jgi:hypothetical protein
MKFPKKIYQSHPLSSLLSQHPLPPGSQLLGNPWGNIMGWSSENIYHQPVILINIQVCSALIGIEILPTVGDSMIV